VVVLRRPYRGIYRGKHEVERLYTDDSWTEISWEAEDLRELPGDRVIVTNPSESRWATEAACAWTRVELTYGACAKAGRPRCASFNRVVKAEAAAARDPEWGRLTASHSRERETRAGVSSRRPAQPQPVLLPQLEHV
jgi:hypothetical protein